MNTNRIANYLSEAPEDSGEVLVGSGRGFVLNPFGPSSAMCCKLRSTRPRSCRPRGRSEDSDDVGRWRNGGIDGKPFSRSPLAYRGCATVLARGKRLNGSEV